MSSGRIIRSYTNLEHASYLAEVARGNVEGSSVTGSYGERTTAGAESNHILWPNGTFSLPAASGVQMTIVSTNVNDTSAGTGVRSIEIHYLDANLVPKTEDVIMNGTTGVLTVATDIRFIQCMHIHTYGTTAYAVGTITAKNAGITYSQIDPNETRCTSSARMVPAGKRLFVSGATAGSSSATSDSQGIIRIVATELDNHQYIEPLIFIPFGSIAIQDNSVTFNFPVPLRFREGSVVALAGTVDKAATLTGAWYGWEEEV